jgi:hypothetical protein
MRKPPVVLALYLAAVLVMPPVVFARAIAHVKSASVGLADDAVLDFGSATSGSNIVVAGVRISNNTSTVDVAGVTETVLHSAVNGTSFQVLIVCFEGGAQTYTFTTQAAATAGVAAAEFSGTDGCVEDGVSDHVIGTTSPISVDAPPTVQSGSLVFGTAWSGNTANYSCDGSYACIPSDGTDVGDHGLAQWLIAGSTGLYYSPFTFTGTENTLLMVAGIAAPGSGAVPCLRGLLGVGC